MKHETVEKLDELIKIMDKWETDDYVNSIMLFGTYHSDLYLHFDDFPLNNYSKNIFGGFYPAVVSGTKKTETGIVCVGLKQEFTVQSIEEISFSSDLEQEVENLKFDEHNAKTIFIFIDAFSTKVETIVSHLFDFYGMNFNYFGGGCGDIDFEQKPCLFSKKKGMLQDAVLFASTTAESVVGVQHGWETLEGPFRITRADNNIIYEIEYRPAFDVYKEVINKHSKEEMKADNFFNVAKAYPFALPKLGSELIIRDPLKLGEDKSITCVADIPENSFVYIMKGTHLSLIQSAKNAMKSTETGQPENEDILVMDCISRSLFLEDNFEKELKAIAVPNKTPVGALVMGEIANQGREYLEYYNKTIVVCRLKNVK